MSVNQLNYLYDSGSYTEQLAYSPPDPFETLSSPNKGLRFPNSNYIRIQPRKSTFSVNTLGTSTHIYTSPLVDDAISLADYFADWGCAYEIQEGPVYTITVSVPWDTITTEDFYISNYAAEQWELSPASNTKPLLTNGLLYSSFTQGAYNVLPDVLKIAVQNAYDNKTGLALPTNSAYSSSLAAWMPYAQESLNYMRAGIEGVPTYTQILKRTAVIDARNSNNAFQTAADLSRNSINTQGSINYILSTNGLSSQYSIPDSVKSFLLPSYSKRISLAAVDPVTYYVYAGWLVKPPTIQFIGRNKLQLTQEFVWDEWSQDLYYISDNITAFPEIFPPAH